MLTYYYCFLSLCNGSIVSFAVLIPCAIRAYRRKRYGVPMWGAYADGYGDNYYATRAAPQQQGYYGNEQPQFAIPVGQPVEQGAGQGAYQAQQAGGGAYQFPQQQGYRLGS